MWKGVNSKMFERLLTLLLHAKSGAVAAVLLLGTTGALVTATVQNGVTTITITEASPSPTLAALTTASPTASPTKSPSPSPSANTQSSVTSSTATDCKTSFEAGITAMQTVNRGFAQNHTDLMHLRESARTDVARKAIEVADKVLKELRTHADEAIHATTSCVKRDEDKAGKTD